MSRRPTTVVAPPPMGYEEGRGALARIVRLLSSGDSGPARAALEFAQAYDIPHGGWVADRAVARVHPTLEHLPGAGPGELAEAHLSEADALLLVARPRLSSPTLRAYAVAATRRGLPTLSTGGLMLPDVLEWLDGLPSGPFTLAVGGPLEEEWASGRARARELLEAVLAAPR